MTLENMINGKPLSKFGAELLKGYYAELLKPAEMKEWVSNEIPSENGIELYPPTTPKVKARTISLVFLLTADDKETLMSNYQKFMMELMIGEQQGMTTPKTEFCTLFIAEFNKIYYLKYDVCTSFDNYGLKTFKLAVTFTEAKPVNYAEIETKNSE